MKKAINKFIKSKAAADFSKCIKTGTSMTVHFTTTSPETWTLTIRGAIWHDQSCVKESFYLLSTEMTDEKGKVVSKKEEWMSFPMSMTSDEIEQYRFLCIKHGIKREMEDMPYFDESKYIRRLTYDE